MYLDMKEESPDWSVLASIYEAKLNEKIKYYY